MIGEPSHMIYSGLAMAILAGATLALLSRRLLPLLAVGALGMLLWEPKILQQLETAVVASSRLGLWGLPTQQNAIARRPLLKIKADENGQFHVMPQINGVPIRAMIDTGATALSLSYEDARRLKLDPRRLNYNVRIRTANGETWAAHVKLGDVRVGAIHVRGVDAMVGKKGALYISLLGMSFLKNVKLQIEGDELALYK